MLCPCKCPATHVILSHPHEDFRWQDCLASAVEALPNSIGLRRGAPGGDPLTPTPYACEACGTATATQREAARLARVAQRRRA